MSTQVIVFLLVVFAIFGVLLVATIKNNAAIKKEKEKSIGVKISKVTHG